MEENTAGECDCRPWRCERWQDWFCIQWQGIRVAGGTEERDRLIGEGRKRIEQEIMKTVHDGMRAKEEADRLRPVAEFLTKNMDTIKAIEKCWELYTG
ncbi:MAG: hypothetical protein HFJ86_03305 [Oscillospiraceae bacterium]|nr:hypothetical protein [Oscillospiraceae bacterium]